ncbi:hypothetical protein CTI12_AA148570 [Artemisia annua]|uniref:Uncharacterized protein n=1 Tax=Artemisia annua TaxID=35608 RepID=A0A2U1PIP6_ARTAN|nr:hypothetical protein CTI12_AA148570 [Artemisia annua]
MGIASLYCYEVVYKKQYFHFHYENNQDEVDEIRVEFKHKLERPVGDPIALMTSSRNHHNSHSSSRNKAKYASPSESEDEEPIESETPKSYEAIVEILNTIALLEKQIQMSY